MTKKNNYWEDERGNKWNMKTNTLKQSERKSKGLVNCKNCIDCSFCHGCSDCTGCKFCKDCSECVDCSFSEGVTGEYKETCVRGYVTA